LTITGAARGTLTAQLFIAGTACGALATSYRASGITGASIDTNTGVFRSVELGIDSLNIGSSHQITLLHRQIISRDPL
jgi:hypothetical protein